VHLEADAVPEPVAEVLGVAAVVDDRARDRVYLAAARARADRRERLALGAQDELVDRAVARVELTGREGARAVRGVAVQLRAPVDDDQRAAVVVLVIMIVTDVSGYQEYLRPDARTFVLEGTLFSPSVLAFAGRIHEGFFLGPLNDMLQGRAMLVDTSSQYGVGVYYFLAAFFQIAPLGYGALGLLAGLLTALQFALAYGVLRLAGVARMLAIPTIVAAVLGLVMGSFGSYNDFPSTGALRYGIPWLIVAVALLAARRPHRRRSLWAAIIALVACASVWSFETFVYAGATYAALVALEAATRERGARINVLPISHPVQDNLVSDQILPKLIMKVDALAPGTLMLTQPATWDTPSKQPVSLEAAQGLVPVQRLALDRIRSRFRLEIVDRGTAGLAIVRLRSTR